MFITPQSGLPDHSYINIVVIAYMSSSRCCCCNPFGTIDYCLRTSYTSTFIVYTTVFYTYIGLLVLLVFMKANVFFTFQSAGGYVAIYQSARLFSCSSRRVRYGSSLLDCIVGKGNTGPTSPSHGGGQNVANSASLLYKQTQRTHVLIFTYHHMQSWNSQSFEFYNHS